MFRSLIAAFSMFSRIPMPKIRGEGDSRYMMCFFPLVGVVLGGVVWCGFSILSRSVGETRFLTAAILTVLPILITGGIHMDGWMDTHDAIHSWKSREERLAILKDPHVGAFAVISAIAYILLTVAGYTEVTAGTIGTVSASFVLSRVLSGLSVVAFPKASSGGTVKDMGDRAARSTRIILAAELVMVSVLMIVLFHRIGVAALIAGLLVFAYYYWMSMRRFGGITGDLAGYFLCLCELMILLTAVIAGRIWP